VYRCSAKTESELHEVRWAIILTTGAMPLTHVSTLVSSTANYVLTHKGTSDGHVYGRLYKIRSYGVYLWTKAARAQHMLDVSVMAEAARVNSVTMSSRPI
jgi:hypothetical protein